VIDNTIGVVSLDPELGYVLTPIWPRLRAAADSIFADQIVTENGADVERQAIADEAARLVVLNGTTQEGLGAQTAADLRTQGFAVSAVGTRRGRRFHRHGAHQPTATRSRRRWKRLIRLFGIAPENVRSEPPSEEQDLTLIVGTDVLEKTAAAP